MELLVFGALIFVGLTVALFGVGVGPLNGSDSTDEVPDERCEECGSVRVGTKGLVETALAPGLGWPRCPACGSPDARAPWLESSIWD
jgi:hypothetical protein